MTWGENLVEVQYCEFHRVIASKTYLKGLLSSNQKMVGSSKLFIFLCFLYLCFLKQSKSFWLSSAKFPINNFKYSTITYESSIVKVEFTFFETIVMFAFTSILSTDLLRYYYILSNISKEKEYHKWRHTSKDPKILWTLINIGLWL